MKSILYIILVHCICSSFILGNIPQKIYSITRQNLSADYYHQQADLWKKELDANAQNKEAWFNYFMAYKILFEKGKVDRFSYERINEALQKAIPQSFESNFAQYALTQDINALIKAYELAPKRYETYADLISYYETKGATSQVMDLCKKWLVSGEYSSGMLHWNYNALIGLDQNAVLLTAGDNHTHPLWLLQHGKNIRQDVQVLNLNLLTQSDYRNSMFNHLGIPTLVSNNKPDIVSHLIQNIHQQSLYLGVSVPKGLVKEYEEELYIIGLAFRHTTEAFNNITTLTNNYENKFLLDYLHTNLLDDISQDIVHQNNVNYLPAFLILYDYYQENNEWSKANTIKNLSLKIADAAQKGDDLRAYLNKSFKNRNSKPMIEISHREIEEGFMPLDYNLNLYASATEVSNEMYEAFLTDLLKRKEFEQLQAHKTYHSDWKSFLPTKHQNLSDDILFKNGAPNDKNTPIQNIRYESAVAFCDWLTTVYNNIEHKKKKFKRVQFRLPTEEEWMLAASSSSPNADTNTIFKQYQHKYPWKGLFVKNRQGCFLANFNNNNEEPCDDCKNATSPALDGAFFTTYIDAYFPNQYGLYNTIGNVAEMVQEKGVAKGGSWLHPYSISTIQAKQSYQKPRPYIGFRVFMEVIEEGNQNNVRKGMMGPPGTLHLQGKLYMDETEVTNLDWLEYMYWVEKNDTDNYRLVIPDSSVWVNSLPNSISFLKYLNHPAYFNYPAVGISHEQAKAYCQWRSKVVNEILLLNPNSLKRVGTVLYRLPTEKEWEYAAKGGLDKKQFPYGMESLINAKKEKKANLNWSSTESSPMKESMVTVPAYSYWPNAKGYYNMIGNVAEMIDQKGIAKGGSWHHNKHQSKIGNKISYDAATPWLGFRCICETNL
ncbi:formylglycine-generating enzyme family protein [Aureispira anguillae]|uniref:Formylglycine-generating enzyme family protein n=1 Tax=Aureispira anguillae TaxID=2864201 RepID=A0A915YLB8_9BACT|nr:formylglycine-generating enzyme family protein [Aureispira anguillae]BDS15124.1 formylglycine-generating enzyme family protein [Aureispira anguillae]